MTRKGACAGFTLLEVVLVIAVLAILTTALAPTVLQRLVESRVDQTRAEELKLYEAVVGRSDEGSYGFVGDIGRLPRGVEELLQPNGLPLYTTQTTGRVGIGWNGPYANFGASRNDILRDAFGRLYTGVEQGQIRSAGADGVAGTADDIVSPPAPTNVGGRLQVVVKTIVEQKVLADPPGCEVRLFYAAEGREAVLADGVAPFIFENVPAGLHAVVVMGPPPGSGGSGSGNGGVLKTMLAQQTIASLANGRTKLVEIWY
jgi:prepilin-type N-terminal cleavage/methylation domain-containing protein